MRSGVILPHTRLYGGVKRFIELGRIFIAQGHSFTLYTPDGSPPNWTTNDVRVASFDDLLKEWNDMLFITDRKYKAMLMKAPARYKIFYHVSLTHKAAKMVLDRRLHVFACSTNVAVYDEIWFGVVPYLAAGGVNTTLFRPQEKPPYASGDPFTVLVYGRIFERVKGTKLVVEACELLHKKYPFIRLLLFDTPVNPSMVKAIEDFDTRVPFDFITNHPVDQTAALFHQADLFVAAEKRTGWANTVAEAMACGIPVVATKSGTADILIHGETGLVVKRNVSNIASGIRKMIKSPELRQRLAANGRKHIEQYDWQILGDRILRWYEAKEMERKPGKYRDAKLRE